jgi:hypothetical protein
MFRSVNNRLVLYLSIAGAVGFDDTKCHWINRSFAIQNAFFKHFEFDWLSCFFVGKRCLFIFWSFPRSLDIDKWCGWILLFSSRHSSAVCFEFDFVDSLHCDQPLLSHLSPKDRTSSRRVMFPTHNSNILNWTN